MNTDHVVLVDEQNNILGTAPKSTIHTSNTPLHRAFSVFIFHANSKKLLLQQRSLKKTTWPGVWSNSCCGHPQLNESTIDATHRRIKEELELKLILLEQIAPYRYNFTKDGIMENEICPILVGITKNNPTINQNEIKSIKWINWEDFLNNIKSHPNNWSPWCVEETQILEKNIKFNELLNNLQ